MATPAEIQGQLTRGWQFFSDLMEKDLQKKFNGCGCCGNNLTDCLYNILVALRDRVDLGVYDATTDKLYTDMMEIIGPGNPVYGPNVDAGPDVVINQPIDTALLDGTVTPGDNPITSIMWTQMSGPNSAVIVSPTTAATFVNGLVPGVYVFKLSAIDTIGKLGSDTTTVTVQAANINAYYWVQDDNTIPSYGDIIAMPSTSFVSGQPFEITFPTDIAPKYFFVAYSVNEPAKTQWRDSVEFWNNGTIGEAGGLFNPYVTVGSVRVTVTAYKTQFANPIIFQ